jgi:hypothetical protein
MKMVWAFFVGVCFEWFLFGVGFRLLDWVLDVSPFWGGIPSPLVSHQTRFGLVYFLRALACARLKIDETSSIEIYSPITCTTHLIKKISLI